MPHETIIKQEFAEAVKAALNGLTPNQASYRTAISDEWIRKMTHGRVPSRSVLERFAKGLGADLHALSVAAGYEEPDAKTLIDLGLVKLRKQGKLSDAAEQEIKQLIREHTGLGSEDSVEDDESSSTC